MGDTAEEKEKEVKISTGAGDRMIGRRLDKQPLNHLRIVQQGNISCSSCKRAHKYKGCGAGKRSRPGKLLSKRQGASKKTCIRGIWRSDS